jgi:hypothetical protein
MHPFALELLSRAARWFVSGVAFAFGVGSFMLCWDLFLKPMVFPPPSVMVNYPEDLSVLTLEPLTVTTNAGVFATLKNSSTVSAYSPSSYELRITLGEKELASCDARYEEVQLNAGETARVQLTCRDVERSAVPPGVAYKLVVKSAWRFL